ncbi:MAG: Maf family protein [Minwuia sp.]|nr:Maf family protein [Minwuia sp.]
MTNSDRPRLILASGSMARRKLLASAGLAFEVLPADVDEAAIKWEGQREGLDAQSLALRLAHAKSHHISMLHSDALVLGADQLLVQGTDIFDKPVGRKGLADHIGRLQGRVHVLVNGVILMRNGTVLWSYPETIEMRMRTLDATEQARYVQQAPDAALQSVGGYRVEAEGIHLFDRIAGDSAAIQGLPLLPVLAALRAEGIDWLGSDSEAEGLKRHG